MIEKRYAWVLPALLVNMGCSSLSATGDGPGDYSAPGVQRPAPKPERQAPKSESKAGSSFKPTGFSKPNMVRIPGGCFQMGYKGFRQHEVCLDRFEIGKYEVTFDEYDDFAHVTGRKLPGDNWGRGRHPVVNVNWWDAKAYANWLSEQTGADCGLPTESEWEYAARAGTTRDFGIPAPSGADNIVYKGLANCLDCEVKRERRPYPVGSYPPNAWGLHDMHGNVGEWVEDCQHKGLNNAPKDGTAWLGADGGNCALRVKRGGTFNDYAGSTASAPRGFVGAKSRRHTNGFRVVCRPRD